METNYGVYHLADNPAQYQPVRTNNYRCICQGLEELVRVGGDANNRNDYLAQLTKLTKKFIKKL